MNYEIIFYSGLIATILTFIITIVAFFKCNVIENIKDLYAGKIKIIKFKNIGNKKSSNIKNSKSNNKNKYSDTLDDQRETLSISDVLKNSSLKSGTVNIENNVSNINIIDDNSNIYYWSEASNNIKNNEEDLTTPLDIENDDVTELLDEKDNDATDILQEESDLTEVLDENEDMVTELMENEDGFSDEFTKELDIVITHVDFEVKGLDLLI